MTPEQLEIVFDTLDVEQKGYLTLDQFLNRFSEYLHLIMIIILGNSKKKHDCFKMVIMFQ